MRHEHVNNEYGLSRDAIDNVINADGARDVIDEENQPAHANQRKHHGDKHRKHWHEGLR